MLKDGLMAVVLAETIQLSSGFQKNYYYAKGSNVIFWGGVTLNICLDIFHHKKILWWGVNFKKKARLALLLADTIQLTPLLSNHSPFLLTYINNWLGRVLC